MKRGEGNKKKIKTTNKTKQKKPVEEKVFETRTKTEAASGGLPQAVINYVVVAQREGDGRTGPHETPSTLSATAAAQWCFVVYCTIRGWTNYGNRDRGYPGAPRQISPLLPPPSLTTITIAVDGAFKKINKTVAVAIPRTKGRRCVPLFSRTVSPTPSLLFNGGKTCIPAPVSNGRDVRKRYGIRRDNGGTRRGRNNIEPSLNRPGLIIIIVAPSRESAGNGVFSKGVLFGYSFSTLSSVPLLPRAIERTCPSPFGACLPVIFIRFFLCIKYF